MWRVADGKRRAVRVWMRVSKFSGDAGNLLGLEHAAKLVEGRNVVGCSIHAELLEVALGTGDLPELSLFLCQFGIECPLQGVTLLLRLRKR